MRLESITEITIRKVSDKELLNLHYRIHQLYSLAKKRNDKNSMYFLKGKHKIVAKEMETRGIKHVSPIDSTLNKVREKLKEAPINKSALYLQALYEKQALFFIAKLGGSNEYRSD